MNKEYIRKIVSLSLAEDMGAGDVTTNALVRAADQSMAHILLKSDGVICGLEFAKQSFQHLDPKVIFKPLAKDGQKVKAGTVIASITGKTRALLTGERVAINFLSFLSGITTRTRMFVEAIKPYQSAIMDTRKTTPLLRELERYAVRCGGGINHRFDLSAMAMIKDNHRAYVRACLSKVQMVEAVKHKTRKTVELEVDNLTQFKQALKSRADIVLLDNMTPAQTKQAVRLRDQAKSKILLEASGGITLHNVRQYAASGVERISVGGLTLSRQALDISLEIIK